MIQSQIKKKMGKLKQGNQFLNGNYSEDNSFQWMYFFKLFIIYLNKIIKILNYKKNQIKKNVVYEFLYLL